jgi:hypothetical protein
MGELAEVIGEQLAVAAKANRASYPFAN